jgi:hypothetical protein
MNIVLSKLNRGSIAGSQGKTAASSGAILARPSDMLPGQPEWDSGLAQILIGKPGNKRWGL